MPNTDGGHRGHMFEITVNNKAVNIEGPRTTGLAIKEAAIAQHVQIQSDFQLAEVHPNGKREIMGDGDPVNVHNGSSFVATAGDDNS